MYIDAARDELSVETDLVAYQVTHQKMYAGAGGTITNNLRALGAQVYCVGILGDDGEGMELKRRLEAVGADTRYMVQTDQRQTCTYIKPMRRENGRETELNRLDIRNFTKTPRFLEDALLENLGKALAHSQAVIICDQFMEEDMAAVTGYVREAIGKLAEAYPEKQWYADSRGHIHQFHNVIVKCNHQEIAAIFGEPAEGMDYERAGQLAGRLFVGLLHGLKDRFGRWMPNAYQRIVLVGALVALFGLATGSRYNGLSEGLSAAALAGGSLYLWDWLAKLCLTAVCLAAGFQGGEVAPLFTIGACLGAVLALPLGLPVPLAAALAYAAVFAAGTNTLVSPILVGLELFGGEYFAAFFLVCAMAYACNGGHSIYPQTRLSGED